jgi:NADH-quinone oxidoreductase subunit A
MGIFNINIILLLVCTSLFVVSLWLSDTKRDLAKNATYECGLEPMGNSRMKFDIIYYVIGILYLIFD